MQLGSWDLQFKLIRSIVLIVFIFIDAIYSVDRIDRIDCIDPGVLNFSALQLKDNSNNPTNSGMTFLGRKGIFFRGYWHLLAFANISWGLFEK